MKKKIICGRPDEDFSRHPHILKHTYFSFWPYEIHPGLYGTYVLLTSFKFWGMLQITRNKRSRDPIRILPGNNIHNECYFKRDFLLMQRSYNTTSQRHVKVFSASPNSLNQKFYVSDSIHKISRDGSRAAATSKMECFVIIVNGFQPLTIITKHSILDVAAALDPPLISNLTMLLNI